MIPFTLIKEIIMKIRSIKILASFSFMLCMTAAATAVNAEDIPPYDYSSFEGTWYNSTEDMYLYVYKVNGNEILFETPAFSPAGNMAYIENNQAKWVEHDTRVDFYNSLTFYDDSILYISDSEVGRREYWFTSDDAVPRKIEANGYSVELNGKTLEFDQAPVMVNNRLMVPVRKIFEELGATVDYQMQTDAMNNEIVTISAQTADTQLIIERIRTGDWMYLIYVNGAQYDLGYLTEAAEYTPPVIINGRTLIPVRFVSEAMGHFVDWNADTRTAIIDTGRPSANAETHIAMDPNIIQKLYDYSKTIPDFEPQDLGSTEFANDFIFYYYTGKGMDRSYTVAPGYGRSDWSEAEVRDEFELLFGRSMPYTYPTGDYRSSVVYNNGYYSVGHSDAGEEEYLYAKSVMTDNGIEVHFVCTEYGIGEYLGELIYNIAYSDNDNGFIIQSKRYISAF